MLIRNSTPQDVLAMASVNVETRRAMYMNIFPTELLANASPERIAVRWTKDLFTEPNPPGRFGLVAEVDNEIVGFIMAGPALDLSIGASGEMYTLYVLPRFHRQGIGQGLMLEAAVRLEQEGFDGFYLWVLTANLASRKFYENLGGEIAGQRLENVKGYMLDETAYLWKGISLFIAKSGR
jgi:ribosomal protein S18 acetylase RimI-like enzyme